MSETINIPITNFQIFLALAFNLWMFIFPIIIIRKLNYLINVLQENLSPDEEESI